MLTVHCNNKIKLYLESLVKLHKAINYKLTKLVEDRKNDLKITLDHFTNFHNVAKLILEGIGANNNLIGGSFDNKQNNKKNI
jgi:hypothetical protein